LLLVFDNSEPPQKKAAMSSGFVSAGSLDKPAERDDEWHKAQQELDEGRKRKMDLDKQNAGKSLFEVLQSNQGDLTISTIYGEYELT
jgi:hypothetical protein